MGSSANVLLQHQHSELLAYPNVMVNSHDQMEKQDVEVCRLESRLMALESEQKKIDAFKRELPLCMQLLHEAIEDSKEQLTFHRSSSHKHLKRPVSRNFDIKSSDVQSNYAGFEPLVRGKPPHSAYANSLEGEHSGHRHCTWSVGDDALQWIHVWNPGAELSSGYRVGNASFSTLDEKAQRYTYAQAFGSPANPEICSKQKLGGAFAPFSRTSRLVQPTPRPGAINPADLSLKCPEPGTAEPPNSCESVQQKAESSAGLESSICTEFGNSRQQAVKETSLKERKLLQSDASNGIQLSRKTRRSWSPELHRLFVDTLRKLGGAQATPKQIRELMKVEGLTNDEVKSHLQKYRLHTKRDRTSPTPSSQAPCVVPVVRAWAPSDCAAHSYNMTSRQSQSCDTAVTRENVTELGRSGQQDSSVSRCCVEEIPRHVRQQQPAQHICHPLAGCFSFRDVGGEESVGEAVKPENSGSKGHHHPGLQLHEPDEIEDHSSNGNQTYSFGEDDKDYEDSPNGL